MGNFWRELKRRNVFKVAVTYAIVSWIALQVADVVFPALNVPPWVLSLLTVLLLIGFPIALLLSWAFELTPDGIKPTAEVAPEQSIRPRTGQRLNYLMTGALAVLLAVVVVDKYVLDDAAPASASAPTAPATADKSIAVLPFVNLSSDQEQEYFSDGLSEEILNQLAQIGELKVTARTSSFSFKGKNADLRVIARELDVRYVLEGSVRTAGNQLRITAQLIDATDGSHVWSRAFDRERNDVFAIQEEIAMAVSETLSVALDVGAMARARGGTTNLEAYDRYLRARALDRQRGTSEDIVRAAELYREAVKLDPTFVRAWSDLNTELTLWPIYVPDRLAEAREEQRAIRARLRELAPASPFTAMIEANALVEARRWMEAEPAIASARAAGAIFREDTMGVETFLLLATGRFREALPRIQRQIAEDPLSLNASYGWQIMLTLTSRDDEADAEYLRSRSLTGERGFVDVLALWRLLTRPSEPAALRAQFELTARTGGRPFDRLAAELADELDDREAAVATLHRLYADPAMQTASGMLWLAGFADHFNDTDLALSALRRSYVDLGGTNIGMLWRPMSNPLRADPRFKDIVRDLGLVDYFRASGNWGDFCRPLPGGDDFEC
ncbi:MAG TPA: FlgO family outer membrane protein [Gammaproteobacteria bacterium]|nr:FlgO family outer membrane protein [Gammaproteobacteria bacterium]